jgi:hypothetical protein
LVESIVPPQVRIGACLKCRQLFLVTYDSPNCYLCGDPPAYTLPFTAAAPSAQPEPVEGPTTPPPAAPPILIGVTCPHCQGNVQLSISDSEISVLPPPVPVADEEPAEPLLSEDPADRFQVGSAEYRQIVEPSSSTEPGPPAPEDDRTTVLSP